MAEVATLARPYANAIFDIAKSEKRLDGWSRELTFAATAAAAPKIKAAIESPSLSGEEKVRQMALVCADELSAKGKQLLHVLARNKRLTLLGEIRAQFEVLRAQEEQLLDVEVVSAHALDDAERMRLTEALGRRFQREIQLSSRVDETLLGGVVIRAGDTVIDGSVRGKLEKLAETLQRT